MKSIHFCLIAVIFFLSFPVLVVAQTSCTPSAGYDYCYQYNRNEGCMAELQFTNLRDVNGVYESPMVKKAYINVKSSGAYTIKKLYVYRGLWSWSGVSCSASGCNGTLINDGEYVVGTAGTTNPVYAAFVAWVYNESGPPWNLWCWLYVGGGWAGSPGYWPVTVVECTQNSHCTANPGGICQAGNTCFYPTFPTVTTGIATVDAQNNQAILKGTITATGGAAIDKIKFVWGTSPGTYPSNSGEITYAGAFEYTLTGMSPGTIYYYKAQAHNSAGWSGLATTNEKKAVINTTVDGGPGQFTTLPSIITYTLAVDKSGTGSGTVNFNPPNTAFSLPHSENYNSGTSVTLTAIPASGSIFGGWSGDCSGAVTCTLSMTAAKSATASFYLLRPSPCPPYGDLDSDGLVTTADQTLISQCILGIITTNCERGDVNGDGLVNSGDLTAIGRYIIGLDSTFGVCTLYNLNVTPAGTGSGTVNFNPPNTNFGLPRSQAYNSGTHVTLTATPATGSTFGGWTGDCTVVPCALTMTAAKNVTATFNLSDFTVSASPISLRGPKVSGTSDPQTTVTVNSLNSFNSAVTLSTKWCTGTGDTTCSQSQPSGLTSSFSANPVTPPANSSINSTLSIDTNNPAVGSYYFRARGVSGTLTHDTSVITLTIVDLTATLTANPNSGTAPLNGVDLTATVSGSAAGTINYKFDCTSDGVWDWIFNNISDNPKTVVDACNYASAGAYTAKVRVERDVANPVEATTQITVALGDTTPPTVSVTGAPANWQNVNATATVACDDGGGGGSPAYETPQSAVASSEYDSTSYPASKARDGNTTTYWFTPYGALPPQWIYFDLGTKKNVSGIKVMIFSPDVPMTMNIQISDDASSWTTVVSSWTVSTGDIWVEKSFTETAARYIRLYETAFPRTLGQCTEFQALTKALGGGSGCDSSTYRLKTYASNPSTCSTLYSDYTLVSPQTISSYLWVCGTAKDLAVIPNTGFSSPVEFKVDKIAPPKPTCTPGTGNYSPSVTVTCSDTEGGVTIRYTTDGTSPTVSSTQYTSPLTFNITTTLTVAAWDTAGNRSVTPDNPYTYTITYILIVNKSGTGFGTVTSTPAGVNCGIGCSGQSASFNSGTLVTLTATADSSSSFGGWTGNCTGVVPCVLTMTAAKNVTATFNLSDTTSPTAEIIAPSIGANVWYRNLDVQFRYSDSGGSGLSICDYKIESRPLGGTFAATLDWTSAGSCSGNGPLTFNKTITANLSSYCNKEGVDVCRIWVRAYDNNPSNAPGMSYKIYNIDFTPPTIQKQ